MIFLHTSDWHLGHTLYNARRHDEFAAFFEWLLQVLGERRVDALLVCGDVFDTSVPGPQTQKLYYDFLRRVRETGCRHVVITAGNHDSPTFLDAPAEVLRLLSVHVVGQARENPEDEVICLRGVDGKPEALVCAIPFLRDRDVRRQDAGETPAEKERRLEQGIASHVQAVCGAALRLRAAMADCVPVVAMAHLYLAGARVAAESDGSRPLYVGNLGEVPASIFSPEIDYVALGHLHRAQVVGHPRIRYCGSVLPMSFSEPPGKSCVLVSLSPQGMQAEEIPIPVFRRLVQVRGSIAEIEARLHELRDAEEPVFVEVIHAGPDAASDLRERIRDGIRREESPPAVEVLRFGSERQVLQVLERMHENETLDELDERQVFERRLDAVEPALSEEAKRSLRRLHEEVLAWLAAGETADRREEG